MSYENFETLKITVDGAIATVTVSREAQLNALSSKVMTELTAVVGELEVSTERGEDQVSSMLVSRRL